MSSIFVTEASSSHLQSTVKSLFRKLSTRECNLQPGDTQAPTSMPTRRPDRSLFTEPPPAYSEAPSITSPVSPIERLGSELENTQITIPTAPVTDDAYSFLGSFDTIFLIDDSGSMAGGRWREAGDAIAAIAPICTTHDADGIDVYFLNSPGEPSHRGIKRADSVKDVFSAVRPGGGTPTGQRLRSILVPYLRRYELKPDSTKPINVICITDGDAHDDVESPLIEAAKKLDALDAPAWQIGVQFFQIGNDPSATELLKYLDDELSSATDGIRDIVDTVPYRGREGGRLTADGVLKVVLGSVNRRLDRRRSKDLHTSAFQLS